MSGMSDGSLLELFREEVRANVRILNDGLVALERDPTDARLIEPLMRAAHSVKGAARVVNIDAAVQLAHCVEDCLVAVQEGRLTLASDDVDVLLSAADLLAGIAESAGPHLPQWLTQNEGEIAELSSILKERSLGTLTGGPAAEVREQATEPALRAPAGVSLPSLESAIESDRARTFEPSPLLDLFRHETRTSATVLREGISGLAQLPMSSDTIESLSKAAQSVRSAARVVNVQCAARLVDFLEGAIQRVQQSGRVPESAHMEELLAAIALLDEIASVVGPGYRDWLSAESQALKGVAGALQGCGEQIDSVPADSRGTYHVAGEDAPPTFVSRPQSREGPAGREAKSAEQVVRVTAQSLTRLMGLAGESLVEARWLQPFSKSLLELKRRQSRLADILEELRQSLSHSGSDKRRADLLAAAGDRLAQCRQMLGSQIAEFENRARNADDLNGRLYHEVIASRMRPFGDGVQGFPRLVRDLARQLGKKVTFEIRGETTEVDRDILEKLEAPLNHILRNALDHGLESPAERATALKPIDGRLEMEARHNAGMLVISVTDDGRGIDLEKIRRKIVQRNLADPRIARELSDAELLEFLFLPAFSTAEGVTEVSGRGVGLDVVHSTVHSVGGSVRIHSNPGQGTTFQLELPITLSVIRAVLVKIAGEPYAFPHNRIDRLVRIPRGQLHALENRHYFEVDGRNVGIVLASQILEMEASPGDQDELFAILFSHHHDQYGLIVEEFCGERDLVVRPLDPRLGKVPNINAAAILDNGCPVLIADLDDMRRSIERKLSDSAIGRADDRRPPDRQGSAKRVLVVDDSITVREVQRHLLSNHGYEVEVAVDGMEGWNSLSRGSFDLVITDIDMPRLNGIELVRMIKNDPRLRSTPVVIVSYKDREEDRLDGLQAGANYYLTKSSFHDETLLGAVRDLIGEAH